MLTSTLFISLHLQLLTVISFTDDLIYFIIKNNSFFSLSLGPTIKNQVSAIENIDKKII